MKPRLLIWSLFLLTVLGFGWYKSIENRLDDERQAAWHAMVNRLNPQGLEEYHRQLERLREIANEPDARQVIAREYNRGEELPVRPLESSDEAFWIDPNYGFRLEFNFVGNKLVAHGGSWNAGSIQAIHPQPPLTSLESPVEKLRRGVTRWIFWVWLIPLPLATVSKRYGLIGAELLFALAITANIVWLVAPNYELTVRGIFSNDRLALGAIMLLVSLFCLAVRAAPSADAARWSVRPQFKLRTLMLAMAGSALLLGMGQFGYVILAAALVCGGFFWILLSVVVAIRRQRPSGRVRPAIAE